MLRRLSIMFALLAVVACRDELGEHAGPIACQVQPDGTVICERDGGPDTRDGGDGDGGSDGGGDARDGGLAVDDAQVVDDDGGVSDGDGGSGDDGDGGLDDGDGGVSDGDGGVSDGDGGVSDGDGGSGDDGDAGNSDEEDGGMDDGDGGVSDGDGGMDDGDGGADDGDAGNSDEEDGGLDEDDGGLDDGDAGVEDASDEDADDGDAGEEEDGGDDDQDGGSGGGCPAQPTCDDVDPNTNARCIPMCDGRCVSKYWRWTFWVTQMNVDRNHSLGLAEHQGIGIHGYQYDFDARYLWNAPGAQMPPWRRSADSSEWRRGDLWVWNRYDNSTTQFQMRTTNPSGETQAGTPVSLATNLASNSAYCGMTEQIARPIYNHGRSLARTFPSDWGFDKLIPMRWMGFAEECRRPDGTACAGTTAVSDPRLVTQCMTSRITDGVCDSQCGNCSYVIPSAGTWTDVIRVATQGTVATFNEGGRTIGYTAARAATATGPAFTTTNVAEWECLRRSWGICQAYGWVWYARPDGFTHCIEPAAELTLPPTNTAHPMQIMTNGITGAPRSLTGKFGHNSNTDAEAEWVTFGDCARMPAATLMNVGACNSVCRGATPCVSRSNTAMNRWPRTAGWHNIDDLSIGLWPSAASPPNDATWLDPQRPIPICRDGGFRVFGM